MADPKETETGGDSSSESSESANTGESQIVWIERDEGESLIKSVDPDLTVNKSIE